MLLMLRHCRVMLVSFWLTLWTSLTSGGAAAGWEKDNQSLMYHYLIIVFFVCFMSNGWENSSEKK